MNSYLSAKKFIDMRFKISRLNKPKTLMTIPNGEYAALNYINIHGGKVLPCDMAKDICVSSARIAVLLKGMENKGLIEKKPDENDKRKLSVIITEKGLKKLNAKLNEYTEALSEIFEKLGEQDSEDFLRISEKFIDLINNEST